MSQQPPIDLLPDSIRRQCEMGARTSQLVGAILAGVLIIVVLATQSRWQLDRANKQHAVASERAEAVLIAQREERRLLQQLSELRSYTDMYDRLALPLNLSAVIATVINELPSSVTIETLDMEAGDRRAPRTSRVAGSDNTRPPRVLVGEMTGFAQTDDDISKLVMRLRNHDGFADVMLDHSRTRVVREAIAREFRIRFQIDLDRPYEVIEAGIASADFIQETEAAR